MERNEPLGPESFIIHALSENSLDIAQARQWINADPSNASKLAPVVSQVPTLRILLDFAPPLARPGQMGWRTRY